MLFATAIKVLKIVSIITLIVSGGITRRQRRRRSPLPRFTSVQVEATATTPAGITVSFTARRAPDVQWYVDHWPLPATSDRVRRWDRNSENFITRLVPGVVGTGKRVTLCLHNVPGHSCITLRPLTLGSSDRLQERLHFPWPALVPGLKARYKAGERTRITASVPRTDHPFNYSATFIGRPDPAPSRTAITVSRARDMEGGSEDGVVTITPVTGEGEGWAIEVATDDLSWEGILLITTEFRPIAGLVERVTLVRTASVYQSLHSAPFPPNFTTTVPVRSPTVCHKDAPCRVLCPYVSNGDVRAQLTRRRESQGEEKSPPAYEAVRTWKWGRFYQEAIFQLPEVKAESAGSYVCCVSSSTHTASSYIDVTVVPNR